MLSLLVIGLEIFSGEVSSVSSKLLCCSREEKHLQGTVLVELNLFDGSFLPGQIGLKVTQQSLRLLLYELLPL